MARDISFLHYILDEVLIAIPSITSSPMFSGFGLYKDGVIFGMILGTQLYFKTNETTRKGYEVYGSKPFRFTKKNRQIMLTKYYEVPVEIMEDREKIIEWVDKACEVGKSEKK